MPDAMLPLRTDALTGGERTELFRLVGSTAGCLPGTPCRVPDGAQAHCSPFLPGRAPHAAPEVGVTGLLLPTVEYRSAWNLKFKTTFWLCSHFGGTGLPSSLLGALVGLQQCWLGLKVPDALRGCRSKMTHVHGCELGPTTGPGLSRVLSRADLSDTMISGHFLNDSWLPPEKGLQQLLWGPSLGSPRHPVCHLPWVEAVTAYPASRGGPS